jgi:predicted amidophosphoribosyltransferase
MFCTKCGKQLTGNANFCGGCGQPITQPAAVNTETPVGGESTPQMGIQPQAKVKSGETFLLIYLCIGVYHATSDRIIIQRKITHNCDCMAVFRFSPAENQQKNEYGYTSHCVCRLYKQEACLS